MFITDALWELGYRVEDLLVCGFEFENLILKIFGWGGNFNDFFFFSRDFFFFF